MERRGFLKGLLTSIPAAVIPMAATAATAPNITPPEMIFDGWGIRWRGWQKVSNQDTLVGQWVAFPMSGEGMSVYSSYPGIVTCFYGDQLFDTAYRKNQPVVNSESTQADLDAAQLQAFERLRDYLKLAGPPPLDYPRGRAIMVGE